MALRWRFGWYEGDDRCYRCRMAGPYVIFRARRNWWVACFPDTASSGLADIDGPRRTLAAAKRVCEEHWQRGERFRDDPFTPALTAAQVQQKSPSH